VDGPLSLSLETWLSLGTLRVETNRKDLLATIRNSDEPTSPIALVAYGFYGLFKIIATIHFAHTQPPLLGPIDRKDTDMELEFDETVVVPSNN
jgi:hypothetical protein